MYVVLTNPNPSGSSPLAIVTDVPTVVLCSSTESSKEVGTVGCSVKTSWEEELGFNEVDKSDSDKVGDSDGIGEVESKDRGKLSSPVNLIV